MNDPASVRQGTIRVLCVDDHAFLVEGLKARIEMESDLEFAGRRGDAQNLASEAEAAHANVVLLDIEMPGPDVFEAVETMHASHPDIRVIMLSAHVRDSYIDAAVDAGAWGYLSKADDPGVIINAIRRVMTGEFVFGDRVLERAHAAQDDDTDGGARPSSKLSLLTPRELQILRLIGKGMTRAAIAEEIHRSPKTVDTHRMSIMDKLDIHDRAELVRFAIREGLSEA
ncbi:MAG: response regulator transcription factor [Planctomycetota bacterium]